MPKRSLAQHLSLWDRLATSARNNIQDLEGLQKVLETLETALGEVRALSRRQITLRAEVQQATRDLDAAKEKANQAAVQVNMGLLAVYGSKSEKLTEYGLRPWRPRRRKAVPQDPQAEPASAPAQPRPRKPRRRRRS
jgi:ABC-type transporter Mla subunit MlaD